MTQCLVRPFAAGDLPAYRAARLASLRDHPEAYGSSWEEEREYDDAVFLTRMLPSPPNAALGGFSGGTLGGMGALVVTPKLKMRHVGTINGVYVAPAFRQAGLGRIIMLGLLDAARQAGVLVVHLTVTLGNKSARRLYADLGFKPYGLARRGLRIGDRFLDEEYMALDLD